MFHVFKGGGGDIELLNHQLLVSDNLFLHKLPLLSCEQCMKKMHLFNVCH